MAGEFMIGEMVENMKGTMRQIRNKVLELITLRMGQYTKENSLITNSTEKEFT
jgi:hypothetical protein